MAYIGNSPANVGNYQIVDDISSSFNGSTTSFALTTSSSSISPAKSGQLLVGVNGVMQQPDDTGTNGFKVSGSNIIFSSAPAASSTFWAVYQGQDVDIGTPSNSTVGTNQLSASGTASNTVFLRGDNTWSGITLSSLTTLGVTSTSAELNILDGVTSTTAELNVVDMSASSSTSGQLLTSAGTGSVPTWSDAPQGVSNSKLFYFGSFS
jgi:hypothetical protein